MASNRKDAVTVPEWVRNKVIELYEVNGLSFTDIGVLFGFVSGGDAASVYRNPGHSLKPANIALFEKRVGILVYDPRRVSTLPEKPTVESSRPVTRPPKPKWQPVKEFPLDGTKEQLEQVLNELAIVARDRSQSKYEDTAKDWKKNKLSLDAIEAEFRAHGDVSLQHRYWLRNESLRCANAKDRYHLDN